MVAAAAQRNEPIDPRKADAMRWALLDTGEQGDLFGEAAPEKERRPFTLPAERPIQQSLEQLDGGMLFSTTDETSIDRKSTVFEYTKGVLKGSKVPRSLFIGTADR